MNDQSLVKTSSVVDKNVQMVRHEQKSVPTWFLVIFLILALFVLKSFIYIKDGSRHGK
ncbi:MAG: hypothetical protein K9K67_03280 [Bacteriovoracaceae bacterium]|nr:hypothetical protein [Bacteriovoracaceae bacterium]